MNRFMIDRRRMSLAALPAAVVMLVMAPVAVAATVPSQVTINYTNPADPSAAEKFSGKVKSSKDACKPNRTVKLQYDSGTGFSTVGTDTDTSKRGVWKLFHVGPGDPPSGDYRAKVTKHNVPGKDCGPDISPTITI
jgi:hypothetical protein